MTDAVRCEAVTRRYAGRRVPPVTAVDRANLAIAPGEFVAIQGPSGSGKSTLLGLLAGIDRPDEGSVRVLGQDLGQLSDGERARLRRTRIGIVFQSFGLVAALSAGDNVALPLTLAGTPRQARRTAATTALAEVGLEDAIDARIDELSGGERQRIGVARALVSDPAIVLADEPSGSLDDEHAGIVLDLLERSCRTRGASLVLVTHDPFSASRADRQLAMRDGRLAAAEA